MPNSKYYLPRGSVPPKITSQTACKEIQLKPTSEHSIHQVSDFPSSCIESNPHSCEQPCSSSSLFSRASLPFLPCARFLHHRPSRRCCGHHLHRRARFCPHRHPRLCARRYHCCRLPLAPIDDARQIRKHMRRPKMGGLSWRAILLPPTCRHLNPNTPLPSEHDASSTDGHTLETGQRSKMKTVG